MNRNQALLDCFLGKGAGLEECDGAPGSCGNGNRQGREQCDGSDLGMQNCRAYGFSGGALACNANCSLDFTNCTP